MADDVKPSPFGRPPIPRPAGAPSSFAPRQMTAERFTAAPTTPPRPVRSPAASARGGASLARGFVAGVAAAAVGAGLWALVTVATHRLWGLVAVAVGFVVGWSVRWAGRGSTTGFGVLGALIALGGCTLGNLLAMSVFLTQKSTMTLLQVFTHPAVLGRLMKVSFSPIELLFYAIAMYEGYRFSIVRRTTR